MKIPYGRSNFADVRRGGYFYVDKTPFLPRLESAESGYGHLVFLRPRRMGKSLLLSMLEHYYDIGRADQFDALFRGLWVHDHPTPERNAYLVLALDFSAVGADSGPDVLRRSFFEAIKSRVVRFLRAYRARVPEMDWLLERIDTYQDPEALLGMLMSTVETAGHKLYVLIDEYDTFANNLLSAGEDDLYARVVERTGFIRTFYRALKSGTQSGAVGRIFITGVSPILLDDLASGFNIVSHASKDPELNTLAGFTRADVARAVDELCAADPKLAQDSRFQGRDAVLALLEEYYDGYRFSWNAPERVFNADMVLYFLKSIRTQGGFPTEMLDPNVRTDYGRLQRLGLFSGAAIAERRALLSAILSDGYIHSHLVEQFGAKSVSSQEQFLSLLYYLGMLTLGPRSEDRAAPRLEIPNRAIRELSWSHLAHLLEEQEGLALDTRDLEEALRVMAVDGDIAPFLELFHARVVKAIGVKDLRQLSEKALKLMLMAFISLSRIFHPLSEKEFAQGYCDLFLGVSRLVPVARFAWLLELKYLPTEAKPAAIEAAFTAAEAQLARYASDPHLVPLLTQGRALKAGALVFVGAQAVHFRPSPTAQA